MADLWLSGVERVPGNSGGAMDGDGSRKFLLHTTEGSSIDGAIAAFRANNSWPHLTVDCPERRVVQHLPFNTAARSLRNQDGGVQTNREGTFLVQVELIGFAETPSSVGSPADLDWFGREVVRPAADLTGFPCVSNVEWVAYPASFGINAKQRLSPDRWDAYDGVLGHQHAPENDHGDPGALDVARILAAANATEDDMPLNDTDKDIIRNIIRQELYGDPNAHKKGQTAIIRTEVEAILEEMLSTSGSVTRVELRELAKLGAEDAAPAVANAVEDLFKPPAAPS